MTSDRAVLSVDFELFAHTPAYHRATGESPAAATAGLDAAELLLSMLDEHDAEATFFVVSEIADRHPDTVRSLAEAGHEIASHTHTHRLLTDLDDGDRVAELTGSRETLERVTGQRVEGFRAPAFDLPPNHFEALHEAGYAYDSSVVPSRRIPGWYGGEYTAQRPCPASVVEPGAPADVAELPVGVMPGLRLPLTGAWIRFFGPWYTALGMRLLARRGITPVLYVHPWELVDLPAVEGVPKRVYWRTGTWMRRALETILQRPATFVTAREAVDGVVGT